MTKLTLEQLNEKAAEYCGWELHSVPMHGESWHRKGEAVGNCSNYAKSHDACAELRGKLFDCDLCMRAFKEGSYFNVFIQEFSPSEWDSPKEWYGYATTEPLAVLLAFAQMQGYELEKDGEH